MMIKPEQVPDAAAFALNDAQKDPDASPWDLIAAALNAWPGVSPIRTDQPIGTWCDKLPAIILPVTENTDDKA